MIKWHPLYSNGMVTLSISFGKHSGPLSYLVECDGMPDAIIETNDNYLDHLKACALHGTVLAPL